MTRRWNKPRRSARQRLPVQSTPPRGRAFVPWNQEMLSFSFILERCIAPGPWVLHGSRLGTRNRPGEGPVRRSFHDPKYHTACLWFFCCWRFDFIQYYYCILHIIYLKLFYIIMHNLDTTYSRLIPPAHYYVGPVPDCLDTRSERDSSLYPIFEILRDTQIEIPSWLPSLDFFISADRRLPQNRAGGARITPSTTLVF
jgi:hypothetical protein